MCACFCGGSRLDPGDTVAKRGDETFALGNVCWKVYDQVRFSCVGDQRVRLLVCLLLSVAIFSQYSSVTRGFSDADLVMAVHSRFRLCRIASSLDSIALPLCTPYSTLAFHCSRARPHYAGSLSHLPSSSLRLDPGSRAAACLPPARHRHPNLRLHPPVRPRAPERAVHVHGRARRVLVLDGETAPCQG